MAGQRLEEIYESDLYEARMRLKQVLTMTPLVQLNGLNDAVGRDLFVKVESFLPVGSFKLRGAYNKIATLSEDERNRGVVTASAGNHGMGVALACKWLGGRATVVVPESAPKTKVDACRLYGANVIMHGANYDEAYREARRIEEMEAKTYIHSVADADIISGQGTIGLEIIEQLPQVKQIVVPIGGGGLISGIALAMKRTNPSVKIIGVQPEGASAYYRSIKENRMVELTDSTTLADGLSVKKVEPYTLDLIKKLVDDVVVVREKTIAEAIRMMLLSGKLLVEGAGAAALAAVIEGMIPASDHTVMIASGANIDQSKLATILA